MPQAIHDFYNSLNQLFNNSFPEGIQELNINLSLDRPPIITMTYIDLNSANLKKFITKKFGLIEIPDEDII